MRSFSILSILVGTALALPSANPTAPPRKSGTYGRPGGIEDIIITAENTLNGTYHADTTTFVPAHKNKAAAVALSVDLFNNFNENTKAYISGLDQNDRLVFVGADGNLIYPSSGGSATPVPINDNIAIPLGGSGQTTTVSLSIPIHSGRIWMSEGDLYFFMQIAGDGKDSLVQPSPSNLQDKNVNTEWGFVEFTLGPDGRVDSNISFVDFVGLVAAMKLNGADGSEQIVKGLKPNGNNLVYFGTGLIGAQDGVSWKDLAVLGPDDRCKRVVSPNIYMGINPGLFGNYFDSYVNAVYDHYSSNDLTVDTQNFGTVNCRVSGDVMYCDGYSFGKPSSADIWGCNGGPFANQGDDKNKAIGARLCAAFHRTTYLIDGGTVQPGPGVDKYYKPFEGKYSDWYSFVIHSHESDGKGYAFSYDDVKPNGGQDVSGLIAVDNATKMTVWVGGLPE